MRDRDIVADRRFLAAAGSAARAPGI